MMRKFLSLLFTVILFSLSTLAFAGPQPEVAPDESMLNRDTRPFSERLKEAIKAQESEEVRATKRAANLEKMPKVAVMYINNSQTTYNDEIDQLVLNNLAKAVDYDTYQYIDGKPYIERLSKIGIVDITTAERADIIDAFEGEDIDYAVFVQIDPFIRKDKVTFFTVGKEMTANVPFKIIDVKNNKYLYNGKFTEIAKDSSMIGGIGNKSVSIEAIEKVNEKILSVIDVRLPKEKTAVTTNVASTPAK